MSTEYLSMNITSAIIKADTILKREYPGLKIFAKINENEEIPILAIDELEKSLSSKSDHLFENHSVDKTVFWLDIINENVGAIRGVHFSDNCELGSSTIFNIKKIEEVI